MNVKAQFIRARDAMPFWLELVPTRQRERLAEVLARAPRAKRETVDHMLASGPAPDGVDDAAARVSTVIALLAAREHAR